MLNFFFKFITISFFIIYIRSDVPEDYQCFEPTSEKLKIGEEVILCIHYIIGNIKEKMGIRIKVDEYSVVSLEGVYDKYNTYPKNKEETKDNFELLAQIGKITSVFKSVSFNLLFNSI